MIYRLRDRLSRLESSVRSLWARALGAGARALPLAGGLLRGAPPSRLHHHLLSALELLPDRDLQHRYCTAAPSPVVMLDFIAN
jgi:hypothetical protein